MHLSALSSAVSLDATGRNSVDKYQYMDYVPRVSSPLTLPPMSPSPDGAPRETHAQHRWSLGLETLLFGDTEHKDLTELRLRPRKRFRLSTSTFERVLHGRRRSNVDEDLVDEAQEMDSKSPYLLRPRRLRRNDSGGTQDPAGNESSWSSHRGNTSLETRASCITLAQLLAEELEELEDTRWDGMAEQDAGWYAERTDAAGIGPRQRQSHSQGAGGGHGWKCRRNPRLRRCGEIQKKGIEASTRRTDSDDADIKRGCMPCAIDIGQTLRSWWIKLHSRSVENISPALQVLVERPMSPEEYHAYFLGLYKDQCNQRDGLIRD